MSGWLVRERPGLGLFPDQAQPLSRPRIGLGRAASARMGIHSSVHVPVDAAHVHFDLAAAILHERGPASELPAQLEPAGPVGAVDLPLVQQASVVVHSSQVNEVAVIHGRAHRARIAGGLEWHLEPVGRRPRDEGQARDLHRRDDSCLLGTTSRVN